MHILSAFLLWYFSFLLGEVRLLLLLVSGVRVAYFFLLLLLYCLSSKSCYLVRVMCVHVLTLSKLLYGMVLVFKRLYTYIL